MSTRTIELGGKRYLWRDILKLRREQRNQSRKNQLMLFELQEDKRPASQTTLAGRYQQPALFKVD